MQFPVFKTKVKGLKKTFDLSGSKERRDYFRSTKAHNVPQFFLYTEILGPFVNKVRIEGYNNYISEREIGIFVRNQTMRHYRHFKLFNNKLVVSDYSDHGFVQLPRNQAVRGEGYGRLVDNENKVDLSIKRSAHKH